MIKKRLFALAMTAVMMLSTSVVAFADDAATTKTENISTTLSTAIEATGTLKQASIKVTVPTSNAFIINPYKLSVTPTGGTTASTSQIVSPTYTVQNAGEVALKVDVTAKATVAGDLTLATSPVASTSTKKEAFIFLNFQDAVDSEAVSALTADGAKFDANGNLVQTQYEEGKTYYGVDKSQVVKDTSDTSGTSYKLADGVKDLITAAPYAVITTSKTATSGSGDSKVTYTQVNYKFLADGAYDKSANQLAVTTATAGATKTGVTTIAAQSSTGNDGGKLEYSICGSTAVNPAKVWTESDTASISITFNFTPVVE
jgi:hypothetical protein